MIYPRQDSSQKIRHFPKYYLQHRSIYLCPISPSIESLAAGYTLPLDSALVPVASALKIHLFSIPKKL
jgi:hypothetical protein